jgi:hypothetical protein
MGSIAKDDLPGCERHLEKELLVEVRGDLTLMLKMIVN